MEPVLEFKAEGSSTVLYVCGQCRMIAFNALIEKGIGGMKLGSREDAVACCQCTKCGAPERAEYSTLCERCKAGAEMTKDVERTAKLKALPFTKHLTYPAFCLEGRDTYHQDLASALDEAFYEYKDEGIEEAHIPWDDVIVYPCTESRVYPPSILEHVDEHYEFEDPHEFSDEVKALAKQLEELLQKQAPVVWYPIFTERVDVAAYMRELDNMEPVSG